MSPVSRPLFFLSIAVGLFAVREVQEHNFLLAAIALVVLFGWVATITSRRS